MIAGAFAPRGRCGTAVSGWMPSTGRGRSVEVISTAKPQAGVNVATCSAAVAVAAGDVVLIAATWENNAARTYSVTSSGGDAVTTDFDSGSVVGLGQQLAHIVVTTTGTITITGTITQTGFSTHGLNIVVLRGVDTSVFDVAAANNSHASAASWDVAGPTTASPRALAFAYVSVADSVVTFTGPAGWTADQSTVSNAHSRLLLWKEAISPGAVGTITVTPSASAACKSLVWAIRPAAT